VVPWRSDSAQEDLVYLPRLDEATLVHNLWDRFQQGRPYTNIGPVLVSLNPHQRLGIYDEKHMRLYQGSALGDHPPHIFATAELAYRGMLREGRQQVRRHRHPGPSSSAPS
jgi:myosin heavy subunit